MQKSLIVLRGLPGSGKTTLANLLSENKKYPVLYMHDGQNCFDKTTAFAGEWGIDETLNYKEKNGDKGCIVVAIDNGGASR